MSTKEELQAELDELKDLFQDLKADYFCGSCRADVQESHAIYGPATGKAACPGCGGHLE